MSLEKIGHLSQILSGLILIVGIGFVVVELRQAKQLAQAQLISDSFAIQADRLVAQLGEDSAAIVAKACRGEEALTYPDAAVLSTKYQLHNLIAFREWLLGELFEFEGATWRDNARAQYLYIFRSTHGRAWWEGMQSSFEAMGDNGLTELETFRNELFQRYSADTGCSPDVEAIYRVGTKYPAADKIE